MRNIQTILTLSVFLFILFAPNSTLADASVSERLKITDTLIKEVILVIENNYVDEVNVSNLFIKTLEKIKEKYAPAMQVIEASPGNYKIVYHKQTIDFPLSQNDKITNFRTLEKILRIFANSRDLEEIKEDLDQFLLKELLLSLDSGSQYITSDQLIKLRPYNSGATGIKLAAGNGIPTVLSTIENSPAYNAGIKAGDRIIQIDGKSTKHFSNFDALKELHGPIDTKVTLTIMRDITDKPLEFVILLSIVKDEIVSFKVLKDDIGYIRIPSLDINGRTHEIIRKVMQKETERKPSPYKGLILDLRDNISGFFNDAINVTDLFLKSGIIVSSQGRIKNVNRKYLAKNNGDEPTCPIAILVNKNTAGGAEAIAGALKDNGRAMIAGVKTYGRGTIQTMMSLSSGAALKLTTARLYRLNGKSIDDGIEPDIVVKGDFSGHGEDLQLQRAIENISKVPVSLVRKLYYIRIWSKVRSQWSLPPSLVPKDNIEALIFIKILRDGSITDVSFQKMSGNQHFDESAMRAVQRAAPFPPLPEEITGSNFDVGFVFHPSDLR
jgi:carboxyl-terminal processing protease